MDIMKLSQPIVSSEEAKQKVLDKVKEHLDRKADEKDGGVYGFEIYCDYNDHLNDSDLSKVSRSDDPRLEFEELMNESAFQNTDYYYPELIKELESEIEEYDEYEDDIRAFVDECVYWYMPEEHFNEEVNVVISLDVGDMNTDFTECNILNWYANHGYGNEKEYVSDISPIKWLAEQQGKWDEVKHIIDLINDDEVKVVDSKQFSKFTNSVVSELVNASSHMNTMIFLVKMKLFDFFKLKELIKADEELNKSYYYDERKGKGKFTVTKNAMCGLFDIWQGGGSVLEIELEKDVVIPTKAIFDVWIDCNGCRCNGRGYDVDDVYGLTREAWSGEVIVA